VDVELVEARIVAVAGELNLELKLGFRDGLSTDRAFGPHTGTAPGPVR
jgi:hypothetical protein